ncbi:MAG: hypothetical protein MJY83_07870 [Bacteroidales bacterium]|nr:hypothetical protein [Bacteroidales bacterium]
MKRIIQIISILVLMVLAPASLSAQGQIHTKKYRLSDFTAKTTKVVLGGVPMIDDAIREEVQSRWRLSPYEFCTVEQYEKIKESSQYYFLICSKGRSKKESEPSIVMLSMVKGGKAESADPTKESMDVVSVPIAASGSDYGREFTFMPAMIDLIQSYMERAMASEKVGMSGIGGISIGLGKASRKTVYIYDGDIAQDVSAEQREKIFMKEKMVLADEDAADEAFCAGQDAVVSYIVAPVSPEKGSYCYKMLIDAQTHELVYFERSAIKESGSTGFSAAELKKIANSRK